MSSLGEGTQREEWETVFSLLREYTDKVRGAATALERSRFTQKIFLSAAIVVAAIVMIPLALFAFQATRSMAEKIASIALALITLSALSLSFKNLISSVHRATEDLEIELRQLLSITRYASQLIDRGVVNFWERIQVQLRVEEANAIYRRATRLFGRSESKWRESVGNRTPDEIPKDRPRDLADSDHPASGFGSSIKNPIESH